MGPSTACQLAQVGLTTVGELADAPLLTVQRLLGAEMGRTLHEHAHGIDQRPFVPQAPVRTAVCERSFDRDELDPEQHRRALLALAEQLGIRLRGEQQVCHVMVLTVRYATAPRPPAASPCPRPPATAMASPAAPTGAI
ncbi:DinB/UmuC family translesion DNA polymerase [Streptomyces sp. NPDC054871]